MQGLCRGLSKRYGTKGMALRPILLSGNKLNILSVW